MRVGLVTASLSTDGGGVFECVAHLTTALREQGIHAVAFGAPGRALQSDLSDEARRPVVRTGPARFGWMPGLARSLAGERLELVHTHGLWMHPSVAALRWSRSGGKPHVVSPHGMLDRWALQRSRFAKRAARLLFEHAHLAEAGFIHALTEQEAIDVRQFGVRTPICIVPNGVHLDDAPVPADDLRGSATKRTLLFLGRLHPKKGLVELLAAWKEARAELRRGDWSMVLAGWDQEGHRAELERLIAESGLGHEISLPGPVFGDQKRAALRNADAFVLPSHSEGLPVAILEAWAHRLPVLMTPACHLPIGAERGAAMVAEPDARSLAQALRTLASMTAADRQRMGANGRAIVEERFTWPMIARRMQDSYMWAIGGGPAPSCAWDGL